MNLVKSQDFFSPDMIHERIHIIGCGSVGGCVAELLARFGIKKMTLYDFDIVEEKNVVNQIYDYRHIGMPKVDALASILADINPDVTTELKLEPEGYKDQPLSGIVFLAVDNIEIRKDIVKKYRGNPLITAMFDIRTELTGAQHYAANWADPKQVRDFFATMDFSHEEAKAEMPVSACGITLGVAPTVRMVVTAAVVNMVNFIKSGRRELKKMVLVDAFGLTIDAF